MKAGQHADLKAINAHLEAELAQKNRELEIEAALERVRARTMAMQKSEELAETVFILFQQFKELGENPDQATIGIVNENEYLIEYWVTMYGNQENKVYKFSIDEPNVTRKIYDAWKHKKKSLVIDLTGKELQDFATYRESMGGARLNKDEKRRIINVAFFSKGLINVQSTEERSEESIKLLERFSAVFGGTYTRFLDLKQAEAQAQEAKIEAALERVRSRSMAMQKSDELKEVIQIVFDQFVHLNINIDHTGFVVDYKPGEDWHFWIADHIGSPNKLTVTHFDSVWGDDFDNAKKQEIDFFATNLDLEAKNKFYRDMFDHIPDMPQEYRENIFTKPGLAASTVLLENIALYIENFAGIPYTDAENTTLMRFGKAFQQTYTRFLDLQKAEAQAREAQIEAALEKVRSRSLAMHQTDELKDVVSVVFEKLHDLDIVMHEEAASIVIFTEGTKDLILWNAIPDQSYSKSFHIPYYDTTVITTLLDAKNAGADFFKRNYTRKEKDHFWNWAVEYSGYKDIPESRKKQILESEHFACSVAFTRNSAMLVSSYKGKLLSEKEGEILKRFARVFEQAYVRFLDLHKAEAQAREAEIQLALERVRARTTAMQKSEELNEVIQMIFDQLQQLNFDIDVADFALNYQETDDFNLLLAVTHGKYATKIHIPYFKHPVFDRFNKAKKKGGLLTDALSKDEKDSFFRHFFKYVPETPEEIKASIFGRTGFVRSSVLMKNTALTIHNYNGIPYSDAENNTLLRFGQVFDETYTRFNDLKQAEEQARESQIQLALERVRARTMAMQRSDELAETATVLFQQLHNLDIAPERVFISIPREKSRIVDIWGTEPGGKQLSARFEADADATYAFRQVIKGWDEKKPEFVVVLKGKHLEEHISHVTNIMHLPFKRELAQGQRILYCTYFSRGFFVTITPEAQPEETRNILQRFAAVFDQTYTRFLDLQKAEEQARESQIQLGLERMRAAAMAMHNSNDVGNATALVFSELYKLGITTLRCGVCIVDGTEQQIEVWSANSSSDGTVNRGAGKLDMRAHPLWLYLLNAWRQKVPSFSYELKGKELTDYYKAIRSAPDYHAPIDLKPAKLIEAHQYCNCYLFNEGCLFTFTETPFLPEINQVLERFAAVFGLTYRRYLDLTKAEAQARESQVEAALERVRSRTLAMQKSDELAETAAVLFRQMISLGIEPNRLYIGTMREESTEIEFWITDEDGSKVSTMFVGDANKNRSMKKMRDAWTAHQKSVIIDMRGLELTDYFHYLGDILLVPFKGRLAQKRRIQYISYFSSGFIGMASPDDQPQETINLLDRFAYVFNLTYARFNDLKLAELHAIQAEQDLIEIKAARQKAEDALAELRITQRQLIQSEKMASLGELTAGIAHEIQNPLNFVNNFSEVSAELIDEMGEELDKGDIDEAKAIAGDLKDNLQKIRHHGGRADGIVKGMLQHSRASSNVKEPTDINKLADEYFHLAYHGLRAKDKSFNTELIMNLDEKLPKANVVPQDIGRVILNMINNAFYATQQKAKANDGDYKPTVEVSTAATGGVVEIRVKDNGNGIPEAIKDKIMQPFFTTKPTGEGTGLGLSLSYDIVVKVHGGKINIMSKEGEGSEFIIDLPI
jgi:signal transduction histidine kinase